MNKKNIITEGYEGFSRGTFGNGGQNIYVSKRGVLQRIFTSDINGDGYPDLVFANSQSMGERPPLSVYDDICGGVCKELPTAGSYDAVFADIDGDGYDDLIVACQNNGTFNDISAFVYFGSEQGLTQKYHIELYAPNSTGVCAGRFDGKSLPSVIFICGDALRLFPNTQGEGLLSHYYEDIRLDKAPVSIIAADFNGDGFDDICIKDCDGGCTVYFGSPGGIDFNKPKHVTDTFRQGAAHLTSTQSRLGSYHGWRPCTVVLDGVLYLYVAQKDFAEFYSCDNDRFTKAFTLPLSDTVYAVSGNLDGQTLVILRSSGMFDTGSISYVITDIGKQDSWKTFETIRAQSAVISENRLIVCSGGNGEILESDSPVYDAELSLVSVIKTGDAMKILSGFTRGKDMPPQTAVVNHETGSGLGLESLYVYLGSQDGFCEHNRLEFPGRSAVEGIMFDFDDDGRTDFLTVNCAENCVHLDPGCLLYRQTENGFDLENPITLDALRSHGAAVGDFNRDGYLDIAVGGFGNKFITVFYGGRHGFTKKEIQLGEYDESYAPSDPRSAEHSVYAEVETDGQYDEVRWLFAADFNGDGWLDIFVSEISGKHSFILYGSENGFQRENIESLATDGAACANAADLDGNGYLDLIVGGHQSIAKTGHERESYITIYWGGKDGFSESRKMMLPTFCSNSVCVGDFNSDGLLDIYATAYSNGRIRDLASYVYLNSPDGFDINRYTTLFSHSGSGCVAGDFDLDGYTDLAVASHKTNGNHIGMSYVYHGGPDGISEDRKTCLPTVGPHGMSSVDYGNIMDRSADEFYFSEIFDISDASLISADIDADVPSSCSVTIRYRSAKTPEDVGKTQWSEKRIPGTDVSDLHINGGFLQYALTLTARGSAGTPRIRRVTLLLQ